MGYFDGLGTQLKNAASGAASGATATITDYFASSAQKALVSVGVAPSGNLTEAEIAAGKTGSPPQASITPSNVNPADISAASGVMTIIKGTNPMVLLAVVAVAVYFISKRR